MDSSKRVLVTLVLIAMSLALVVGLSGCGSEGSDSEEPAAGETTEETQDMGADEPVQEADPGYDLVETKCSMCHATDRVWAADYDRDTWATTMDRMQANGLVLSEDEYDQILDYLAPE